MTAVPNSWTLLSAGFKLKELPAVKKKTCRWYERKHRWMGLEEVPEEGREMQFTVQKLDMMAFCEQYHFMVTFQASGSSLASPSLLRVDPVLFVCRVLPCWATRRSAVVCAKDKRLFSSCFKVAAATRSLPSRFIRAHSRARTIANLPTGMMMVAYGATMVIKAGTIGSYSPMQDPLAIPVLLMFVIITIVGARVAVIFADKVVKVLLRCC